jgi:hypothetical protein
VNHKLYHRAAGRRESATRLRLRIRDPTLFSPGGRQA